MARLYEVAGQLAEFCQSLFPLLVAHSDDFGRMHGDPFTVRMVCMPISPRTVTDFSLALQAMDDVRLIRWYDADGETYIQVLKFEEHQPGLSKRTKSKHPEPHAQSESVPRVKREEVAPAELSGTPVKFTEIPSELKGTELNRTELKGTEQATPPFPEQTALARPNRSTGIGLVGNHNTRCPEGTWDACARGLCVPKFLAEQWRTQAQGAGADPDVEVRATIADGLANAPPFVGKPLEFWKGVWEKRHPTPIAAAPSTTKTGRTMAAALAAMERRR